MGVIQEHSTGGLWVEVYYKDAKIMPQQVLMYTQRMCKSNCTDCF
ncbi:Uncharacterised protein [Klebsiella pneumoniae]|uniref:Uncharacterized protein n=1 Tax=Klebsiella pneumoniae TaxID=573 RepID=A0A7H9ZE55_KLEPN|nr:Uncharacterised protein [Serratia marcescens]SWB40566.1 Uncharacterised protein [Klebsiella pneumoniae]SWB93042.1 Uncharacterised protein [Klebsiella pneumoniae]SWG59186.1 Uncharacterised protein [Klebsiella pneumoniae]SWG91872.1 Uncharacterised protein [Klebsiella pneumoniae]